MCVWQQNLTSAPADLVAKITDNTPSPTPDPTSIIVDKIANATSDFEAAVQKVTGFTPPPGGFSKVSLGTNKFLQDLSCKPQLSL